MEMKVKKGDFSQLGVIRGRTWANFCINCRREADCKVLLYVRGEAKWSEEIAVPKEYSAGNIRAVRIEGLDLFVYDYNFLIDGKVVSDPFARRIVGRDEWANTERLQKTELRCRYTEKHFSWRGECKVEIPRKDMILYKLHVRGFTKGLPESTPDRGTFRGLSKKLSYLKALGVTSIELMPVYEFEELVPLQAQALADRYANWRSKKNDKIPKPPKKQNYKINFWGYGEGYYFAPKASYAAGEDPDLELKECILQMHKKGMECILEMDFSAHVPQWHIVQALRYWVEEYHVDGFHLQGDAIPLSFLMEDPYLGRTKLLYKGMSEGAVPEIEKKNPRAFLYTDEFLYPSRKLASGIDGNIWELANQLRKQNEKLGYVNYIADNNGFTLLDLFSYEKKHNEANGENNEDGPLWNFSVNCGVEGDTSSKNVYRIRNRRMKNMIAMLFLSQGVPLLMAGDEDCNSQRGNNNAYCQDGQIGWKDWRQSRQSKDFLKFVKKMIAFRKQHAILRMEQPMKLLDTKSCGCPDLSYHGEDAWMAPNVFQQKAIGVLYCGRYAGEAEDVYLGFNFSDFPKKLALPKPKGKRKWYLLMDTGGRTAFLTEQEELGELWYILGPQSVCIIICRADSP